MTTYKIKTFAMIFYYMPGKKLYIYGHILPNYI